MTRDEARLGLANQQAMIDSNVESVATMRRQREQVVKDVERLQRGDDLRTILIEGAAIRLASLDQVIAQTEDQIRFMQAGLKHLRNAIEG